MVRDRESWPFWVRLGLWGLPTRSSAMAFMWLSLFLFGLALLAWWKIDQPLALKLGRVFSEVHYNALAHSILRLRFAAVLCSLIPVSWYFLAIRWADSHKAWNVHSPIDSKAVSEQAGPSDKPTPNIPPEPSAQDSPAGGSAADPSPSENLSKT